MERVLQSADISPLTVSTVGVAVHRNSQHIGVLHRVAEGEPAQILHLAWHERLRSERPTSDYILWTRPQIEEDRGRAVAAFCRRIAKQSAREQVPYGFSQPNDFFDSNGAFLRGPSRVGLTCASFVLAVFQAAGLPLAHTEQWPVPTSEDLARQRELLELLKQQQTAAEHLSALEKEVGNVRFRPLEVAGASTSSPLPASYEYAAQLAKSIQDLIDTLLSRTMPEKVVTKAGHRQNFAEGQSAAEEAQGPESTDG